MEYIIICIAALLASSLTMFSGFGLGTLLLPIFAIFMPIELAVAATAVVHGANSMIKAIMLGKSAEIRVVLIFGLPAIVFAVFGAWLLGQLSGQTALFTYEIFGRTASITPLKLLMGVLMIAFAVIELHPRFVSMKFDRRYLPLGGILSGFFGGLSGHQGALRSAFLAKVGISTEGFVGTNAIIGLLVDLSRLSMYATLLTGGVLSTQSGTVSMIGAGIAAAFVGVILGNYVLKKKKITMRLIQQITGIMLFVIALLLGFGIL
jgi:hypothetical protein